MLKEQIRRFSRLDWKVLLYLLLLTAPKWRVRKNHVVAILLLYVSEILGERIGVNDVGCLDAMQDHVHDRDNVGEALLFLPVKGAGLERRVVSVDTVILELTRLEFDLLLHLLTNRGRVLTRERLFKLIENVRPTR